MGANWPLTKQGARGERVRSIQYLLRHHGHSLTVDGIFGPVTDSRVRAFQGANSLGADGIVGNQTWPRLIVQVSHGSSGEAVRAVQSQLRDRYYTLTLDGAFGPKTDAAVRDFQTTRSLASDGIVGPQTWRALVLASFLHMASCSDAATYLFDAWRNNNRQKARHVATREVVDALQWGVPGPAPDSQGCRPNTAGCDCAYTYEGGSMHFHVAGDGGSGHYVKTVSFVAD